MSEPESWYGLFLGNSTMAKEPIKGLIERFFLMTQHVSDSTGMAMFAHWSEPDDDGENEVNVYFSPAAAEFAKAIPQAGPCERPSREGLHQIGGYPVDWTSHFP